MIGFISIILAIGIFPSCFTRAFIEYENLAERILKHLISGG